MILRVFRGGVRFADESTLLSHVRDRAIPTALAIPGLRSFQPAVARSDDGLRLVLVSTWTGFDAILSRGQNLDTPLAMPDAAGLVEDGHSEHYELMVGNARRLPLSDATLRVTRVLLERDMEPSYFNLVRRNADDFLEQEHLVAFLLGRRTVAGTTEALITSVWDDAFKDGPRGLLGGPEASRCHASPPTTELFRALSIAPPSNDAPAILLADDERQYVHATPAAAELTGHSVAALLSMRIDDLAAPELRDAVPGMWARFLAEGSLTAGFSLRRRDGSDVAVRFSARARTPWPGTHASMMVLTGTEASPDIDAALVEAGFVSRYALAT